MDPVAGTRTGDLRGGRGFKFSFNARFPGGGNLFGGMDFGRETFNRCDSPFDPNTFRFCDTTGGDGEAQALTGVPNAMPGSGLRDSPPNNYGASLGNVREVILGRL